MKKKSFTYFPLKGKYGKILIRMKLTLLLLLAGLVQVSAISYSQATKLSLEMENRQVAEVLREIESISDFRFFYQREQVDVERLVNIRVKDQTIDKILDKLFPGDQIEHKVYADKLILIAPREILVGVNESTPQPDLVSGTVTDEEGNPVIGATVKIKGTTTGTITDAQGKYSLSNVPEDAVLMFSFVGMKDLELAVGNQTLIDVSMEPDILGLDEVVVIGYGSMKKSDLTGAVSQINAEKLQTETTSNLTDILRANVPGLNISKSFEPDEGGNIIIRGQTSIGASNEPLIVLDGMVYYGEMIDINPNDIERIDVLKDASSAAIYGARAANGVILITTKKGKEAKPTINVSSNVGLVTRSHMAEELYNPQEFIQWRTDAYRSSEPKPSQPGFYNNPDNLPAGVTVADWLAYTGAASDSDTESVWLGRIGFKSNEIENYKAGETVDWMDKTYQTGLRQDYNLSLSGATPKLSYYWSLGYVNNEGVIINDWYQTVRSRLNLEAEVNKFISVGLNTQYSDRDQSDQSVDNYPNRFSPYSDFYEEDGKTIAALPSPDGDGHSWLKYYYTDPYRKTKNLLARTYIDVNLPLGFTFSSSWTNRFMFNKDYQHNSSENPLRTFGDAQRNEDSQYDWLIDNILKWNKTFNGKHNFDVTLLQSAEKYQSWYSQMLGTQFEPNDNLGFHNMGGATVYTISSNDEASSADALMARLNYNYDSRYMFSASWRRDGYSAFGNKQPRADFWSVAAGWALSEENFYQNDWLPYLKLRLSYGTNGNREVGRYAALAKMGAQKIVIYDGSLRYSTTLSVNEMENSDLKWENTASFNVGLDFNLLNTIRGNIEYYSMNTTDLLIPRSLPSVTGYSSVMSNLGEIQNRGLEMNLSASIINNANFKWEASGIMSLNRNKILSLYGDIDPETGEELDDPTNNWYIGESLYRIYGYKVVGVWQEDERELASQYGNQPGDFKIEDVGGYDGSLSDLEDKQFQGYSEPRVRWSIRNNFNLYRNFDVSILVYSHWGHKAGDPSRNLGNRSYFKSNEWKTEYWTPENPTNEYARNNASQNGSYVVDKSFIRIDNISLSYTVPKNISTRIGVSNFRASFIVRNPYVWTKQWDWWDPESNLNWAPDNQTPENRYVPVTNYAIRLDLTI